MKIGAEDGRKKLAAGVLGGIALLVVAYELYGAFSGGTPAPRSAAPAVASTTNGKPAAGPAAVKVGTTSAQLDPSLHMEAMLVTESLSYSGSGRNIFAPGSPQELIAEIPLPKAP